MEYFFKLQRLNDEYKIVTKKNNNQRYKNDIFIKFDNLNEKIKQTKNTDITYLYNNLYKKSRNNTLFDFFYSNLLLKIGGIIIIDDALHYGVNKCIKYIETNYLSYTKLNSSPTIAVFKKREKMTARGIFIKTFNQPQINDKTHMYLSKPISMLLNLQTNF